MGLIKPQLSYMSIEERIGYLHPFLYKAKREEEEEGEEALDEEEEK